MDTTDSGAVARHLAETVAEAAEGGVIIVISGLPAAGKSTLSERLRELCSRDGRGVVVLDKDHVAHPYEGIAMAALTGDEFVRDGQIYRRMVLPHIESILTSVVQMMYDAGTVVIVDHPAIDAAQTAVDTGRHLTDVHSEHFDRPVTATVWMDVDADTQRDRMIRRGFARDDFKLADFDGYRAPLGPVADFPAELCDVRLNTT